MSEKYTISEVSDVQKRALTGERMVVKARKMVKKAETELAKAHKQFDRATKRYEEAKGELDVMGVLPATKGFRLDADGYVIPSRRSKLVR